MELKLRISHAGMACSLGLDSLTACASMRAGLSRAQTVRTVSALADPALEGRAVIGHCLPAGASDGYVGLAKAASLGRLAMADLERHRPFGDAPGGRTLLYLALTDRHWQDRWAQQDAGDTPSADVDWPSRKWRRQITSLADMLAPTAGRALRFDGCNVVFGGHAALAQALHAAAQDLASGAVQQALVGAVDSCIEPAEVQAAANMGALKMADAPSGFMPGEAAVFMAVDVAPRTRDWQTGTAAALYVLGFGEAMDGSRGTDDRQAGNALTQAMLNSLSGLPAGIRDLPWDLASDINGDPRRAAEWGHCMVRMQALGQWRVRSQSRVAETVGEVGCASGGAALALALHGARRGYLAPRPTLFALSSDAGQKAALIVAH